MKKIIAFIKKAIVFIKQWKKWILVGLVSILALIIFLWMVFKKKSNGDRALKLLDKMKIGLQHKITVIEKRQKKREKLIKIIRKGRHDIGKNVKRMSDSELDKYIDALK